MSFTYTCEVCKKTYTSEWSREEAEAEARRRGTFSEDPADRALVCDDCDGILMRWLRARGLVPS